MSTKVTAGCYGADSEGWFDPWALLQVQSSLYTFFDPLHIINHLWNLLIISSSHVSWDRDCHVWKLQAFKVSAQHGGVEYLQGKVTQVQSPAVFWKYCTNLDKKVKTKSDGTPSSAIISGNLSKEASLSISSSASTASSSSAWSTWWWMVFICSWKWALTSWWLLPEEIRERFSIFIRST